jgi:hypothetical protein
VATEKGREASVDRIRGQRKRTRYRSTTEWNISCEGWGWCWRRPPPGEGKATDGAMETGDAKAAAEMGRQTEELDFLSYHVGPSLLGRRDKDVTGP